MALTKARTSHLASQTASVSAATAQSNAEDVSDSYDSWLSVKYVQSSSDATVAGEISIWVCTDSGTGTWFKLLDGYTFPLAQGTTYEVFQIPFAYDAVGVEYAAPTGGTGTLDVDLAEVTALS